MSFFGKNEGRPVTIVITEHTYIDGKLAEQGTVIRDVPHENALELAAAGKARPAKEADIAAHEAKQRKRAPRTPAGGGESASGPAAGAGGSSEGS